MMKRLRPLLLKWHRRIGIIACVFLLLVTLTGIALQHSRTIGLDQVYIENDWVLKAYNMQLPDGYVLDIVNDNDQIKVETVDGQITFFEAPDDLDLAIQRHYRGNGISVERLLLDLHTGNIAGFPGQRLIDLTGLAIIFLSLTGLYNWWKGSKK